MEHFYEEPNPGGGRMLKLHLTNRRDHSNPLIEMVATCLCSDYFFRIDYAIHIEGDELCIVFPKRKSPMGGLVCQLLSEVMSVRITYAAQRERDDAWEAARDARRADMRALRADFGLPEGRGL